MLLASWVGTYADLILVNKQLYAFPVRPFPDLFAINILFTWILLPLGTAVFLSCIERMRSLHRIVFILVASMAMSLVEPLAEQLGLFAHREEWSHLYSVFGYLVFLSGIWKFHRWLHRSTLA
jgi:predicted membrane channel-forming protein YqfA (hemolysin III family)